MTMTPQDLVEAALSMAGECDMAAIVTHTSEVNLRWAANSLTTNGASQATQVDIVAMHPRGGTATTSGQVADAEALTDLVARATAAAATAEPDPEALPLPAGGTSAHWGHPPQDVDVAALQPLATGLGAAFRNGDDVEQFGYAEVDHTTVYLGTTADTRLRHVQRQSRAEFTAKTAGRTRSAWAGSAAPDAGVDVGQVTDELRTALEHQTREVSVAPGRHRVILSPSATADLMIDLYYAADARSAVEGRSAFAGTEGPRWGERLGVDLTLSSDPADTAPGMACAPFELTVASSDSSSTYDNGLALQRTEWISGGTLANLISTRHTAAGLGRPATPGIDNLTLAVAGGHGSLTDLVARTESGLLVTCLWYNRVVDPQTLLLTGLTRDGVYVVRDGRIVGSCGNFRFNESPLSVLGRIVDSSDEVRTLAREMGDYFNRAVMPALVVEDFNLSTASEAH